MRIIIRQHHRGATVLLKNGEDVLEEIELQCLCDSRLLVRAQESSRLMMSDSFEVARFVNDGDAAPPERRIDQAGVSARMPWLR